MYKQLGVLFISCMLVACGKDSEPQVASPQDNLAGRFEGYYELPNNGYIEIVQDSGALFDSSTLRLVINNADGTTALIPLTTLTNLPMIANKLYYSGNLTYAAGNNLKADSNNAALTGSLFTVIALRKDGRRLVIDVKVSSGAALVFTQLVRSN